MRWDRRTCEWAHEESKEPPSVTHALNQHCLCQTGSKASFSFSLSPRIGATVSTHIHKLLFTTCRGSCFGSSSEKKAYISSHYTLWMCCNRFALREKKKKKALPPATCCLWRPSASAHLEMVQPLPALIVCRSLLVRRDPTFIRLQQGIKQIYWRQKKNCPLIKTPKLEWEKERDVSTLTISYIKTPA